VESELGLLDAGLDSCQVEKKGGGYRERSLDGREKKLLANEKEKTV